MPTKSKETAPVMIRAKHPSQEKGKLKQLGGSASDDFNTILANQVVKALWLTYDETGGGQLRSAAMASPWPASSSLLTAPPWSATGVP